MFENQLSKNLWLFRWIANSSVSLLINWNGVWTLSKRHQICSEFRGYNPWYKSLVIIIKTKKQLI